MLRRQSEQTVETYVLLKRFCFIILWHPPVGLSFFGLLIPVFWFSAFRYTPVPCVWARHRKCTIAKLGAHLANTQVAVCRRPKIVSSFGHSSRTAKIGEVSRCHSTKWFESHQTQFKLNTLCYTKPVKSVTYQWRDVVVFLTTTEQLGWRIEHWL